MPPSIFITHTATSRRATLSVEVALAHDRAAERHARHVNPADNVLGRARRDSRVEHDFSRGIMDGLVVQDEKSLSELIARVRAAQSLFSTYTQEQVDKIFLAAATAGAACALRTSRALKSSGLYARRSIWA